MKDRQDLLEELGAALQAHAQSAGIHYMEDLRGQLGAAEVKEVRPAAGSSTGSEPGPRQNLRQEAAKTGSSSSRESVAELKKRVIREDASQWSAQRKLEYLRLQVIGDCQRCGLARTRQNIVFGRGSADARLLFVGEAPGQNEDRQGQPFVGAAGQRLERWIATLGLDASQVYIANVLKCRPPRNRDPEASEVRACSPFLQAQIRAIEPDVIVALGRHAGNLLLGTRMRMYEMRGELHRYQDPRANSPVPVVVTYHPAYVLRAEQAPASRGGPGNSSDRKSEEELVLDDLRRALSVIEEHARA